MILNFLNAIIVIVGEDMKEEEITIDGVKSKIVVDLDDDYIEKLSDDEINEFERTIDLSTITKDLEKTMEINLND